MIPRKTLICTVCHVARHGYPGNSPYCRDCAALARPLIERAMRAVAKAIRTGAIPRANTLYCVDCGRFAWGYDHRDYARPLDVQPVCRRCNIKRGPALQLAPGSRVRLHHAANAATGHRKSPETSISAGA